MKSSLRVGKPFGIPLDLHWTLLLVLGWIFYDGYQVATASFHWERIGWVAAVIFLLFFFVLVHEFGHALTAKAFGRPTEKILLFPLGGGAYIREQPASLGAEILVYFGGPLANVLLSLLLLPALLIDSDRWLLLQQYVQPSRNLISPALWWEELLCLSIVVNLVLAVINLLPAYPLDGGRILQAVLRKPLGERRATLVVTILGLIAAVGFVYLGLRLSDPLMGVGGLFVGLLSAYEINRGWQRRRLKKFPVKALTRKLGNDRIYSDASPAHAKSVLAQSGWPALPVYNRWNQLVGLLTHETLADLPPQSQTIINGYDPAFATGFNNDNLLIVTERIIEADAYGALIFDRDQPVGVLFMEDIMNLLEQSRFQPARP